MGEFEPLFILRAFSAPKLDLLRAEAINKHPALRRQYFDEYVEFAGAQGFLNASQNYPLLAGAPVNTYKCFIERGWFVGAADSVQGFVHPEGVYDDPNGGRFRRGLYPRLRYRFQFENELSLFEGTNDHGRMRFGVSIYGGPRSPARFSSMTNLFLPITIDASFLHDGSGPVGGIKDDNNQWNIAGHLHRIVDLDEGSLSLFASLYDEPGTHPLEARLPALHARELLDVVRKFATNSNRLATLAEGYSTTQMWYETPAVMDGTIRRETAFVPDLKSWILSGPHFSLGNPAFKTPRAICTANSHYDPLDLTTLPDGYLPRANYVRACDEATYLTRTPRATWGAHEPVTNLHRLFMRRALNQSGERTLIAALIPPGPGHIDGCFSLVFASKQTLLSLAASSLSVPSDFLIKTTGKGDIRIGLAMLLPIPPPSADLFVRTLLLNCVTSYYASLWNECFDAAFTKMYWSKRDPRLSNTRFSSLSSSWAWEVPLRTDYERRQALVEIDVLTARALKLTLQELCSIYRLQFPVLQQNEQDTWYDQRGRIVFTCSKAVPGVGFSRPEFEKIRHVPSGTVTRTVNDDTLPGGPYERIIEYLAPFDCCDREADYRTAWEVFDKEGA